MLERTRLLSRFGYIGSGGMLIQDHFKGLVLNDRWTMVFWIVFGVSIAVNALLNWRDWRVIGVVTSLLRLGPQLSLDGATEYWRVARASRGKGVKDLQVLYARVYNSRNGGGDRATFGDAEILMEAHDEAGALKASCKGNWLYLGAGTPYPFQEKALTLKPTRERYGIEIAGKFPWYRDAWLAGQDDPPSLSPGVYTIRASIVNGRQKATVFEWKITNPGDGALEIDGVIAKNRPEAQVQNPESEDRSRELIAGEGAPEETVEYTAEERAVLARSADRLRKAGGAIRQQAWKSLNSADPSVTPAQQPLISEVNEWLTAVRNLVSSHYGEEARRVSIGVPEGASVQQVFAAIDDSLPPIVNFKKYQLGA